MIEVSFTFTPERLTDALRHYRQQTQHSRQLARIFLILFVPIATLGMGGGAWLAGFLTVLCVLLLLVVPYIAEWLARRSFRKSPFCNEEIVQRFDETGLHEASGKSDSHLAWSTFTKAVHFDDGFLLFSGPRFFRWVPINGFVNSNDISDFQQLLRANINEHKLIEQTNEKGIKNKLSFLALSTYLGLTGEDFSRKERSKTFRWSIRGFWLSFLFLMVVAIFGSQKNVYWMIIVGAAVCMLLISGITFIVSIAARDIPKWKQNNWRFSLRDLLIVITVIALALGGMMLAARN